MYLTAGREKSLLILGVAGILLGILEAWRLRRPVLNQWLIQRLGHIHREKEVHRPSGIFWTLIGSFLTMALIPEKDIVVVALLYLVFADGVAGLVGRRWGRTPLMPGKSMEGTLSAFLVAWAIGTVGLQQPAGAAEPVWGALVATGLEVLSLPPDDNFSVPLLSGLFLHFLRGGV